MHPVDADPITLEDLALLDVDMSAHITDEELQLITHAELTKAFSKATEKGNRVALIAENLFCQILSKSIDPFDGRDTTDIDIEQLALNSLKDAETFFSTGEAFFEGFIHSNAAKELKKIAASKA